MGHRGSGRSQDPPSLTRPSCCTQGHIASRPLVHQGPRGHPAASVTSLPSHSGLGAEEPLSSTAGDASSPLSTGYNTRSGSEEIVTEPEASLHGSGELPTSTGTRPRTASELLLDRCAQGEVGMGQVGPGGGSAPA